MKKFHISLFFMALLPLVLLGVEVNDSNIQRFVAECEAQNAQSCDALGTYYSNRFSVLRDSLSKELKLKYYTMGCNLKNAHSCFGLAVHYDMHEHDEKQYEAFAKKACDYKYPASCTNLAHFYTNKAKNDSTKRKDLETMARIYYKKGCDLGDRAGCSYK